MADSKDKTKIIFHKGTHTIGGTLIEISYKESRIFFDLGAVFDPNIKPNSMDDLLDNKLVSFVDGLYDPMAFNKPIEEKEKSFKNQACFISHAHLDHTSIVNFTNPNIKVYASKDTAKVLEALSLENDFVFPFTKNQEKSKTNIRKIEAVNFDDPIIVGDLKVSLIAVDHDAYGACGFLIESPNMKIAYSGDIRRHGFREESTNDFIRKVRGVDLLITEAVSFSFYKLYEDDLEECLKESELVEKIVKLLKNNNNRQITFNYYPTNFERIRELIRKTKDIRKLVLTSFNAYLLKEVMGIETYYYKINDKAYGLDPSLEISLEELLDDRQKYLWQIDVKRFDIVDKLKEKGLYIHSDAEPLGEYDPFYKVFIGKYEEKNIEVRLVETSGHGKTRDIYQIIKEINPKLLAPIHSFKPERVYYYSDRLLSPSDGDTMLF
ncbi:MAG: MBL fold metallo-hydrolase [Peptoniphilaceae bacterium]|nr:MBL fold metallo-hydrolase [Peptoniphilaceae bacterium]MDY6019004.1 MBL fold metallo-hydrolase [Anaerococcus sp.]